MQYIILLQNRQIVNRFFPVPDKYCRGLFLLINFPGWINRCSYTNSFHDFFQRIVLISRWNFLLLCTSLPDNTVKFPFVFPSSVLGNSGLLKPHFIPFSFFLFIPPHSAAPLLPLTILQKESSPGISLKIPKCRPESGRHWLYYVVFSLYAKVTESSFFRTIREISSYTPWKRHPPSRARAQGNSPSRQRLKQYGPSTASITCRRVILHGWSASW